MMDFTSVLNEQQRNAGIKEEDCDDASYDLIRQMRIAVCHGPIEKIEELINLGFDINTPLPPTECTALMLACNHGKADIAAWLLEHGADPELTNYNNETVYDVYQSHDIKDLLRKAMNARRNKNIPLVHNSPLNHPAKDCQDHQSTDTDINSENELVLKIRIADSIDPDFIEVEIPRKHLSYLNLLALCRLELRTELRGNQILKLRKLPNTRLRKDKDVQRLKDFDEIEVVINGPSMNLQRTTCSNGVIHSQPIVPTNVYQSISKKDQTILY